MADVCPDIEDVVRKHLEALAALLDAIVAHDRSRAALSKGGGRIELIKFSGPIPTREESFVENICGDAVGTALRHALRTIGEYHYEYALRLLGDRDEALDSLARLAEDAAIRDESHYGRRIDVCDKRFDGIGRGGGHPGWCC